LWCGNDGTVRAKASALPGLEGRIQSGIGLTVAMQAMSSLDQLQPVEGMGPVGEVRLVPDPSTFRVLPYAPHVGAMLVDHVQLDGEPAADEQLLTRETIRGVASRHGLVASLAPKPWPENAGNGCHIHFSLWEADGSRNRFHDESAPDRLSDEARSFVAGVLAHLPGLCG